MKERFSNPGVVLLWFLLFLPAAAPSSYAETWLAIVDHYRMAEIVGEATAGTNGTINHVHLPGGYELRFTGLQTLKHDGSRYHGVGVQPTIPVTRTLEGVREGRDELLEKAIETLQ